MGVTAPFGSGTQARECTALLSDTVVVKAGLPCRHPKLDSQRWPGNSASNS